MARGSRRRPPRSDGSASARHASARRPRIGRSRSSSSAALNAASSLELRGRGDAITRRGSAGLTTSAFVYLLAERQLRPAAPRALAVGVGERRAGAGVKTRALLAWAVGTGVPILGLIAGRALDPGRGGLHRDELAIAVLALGGLGLAIGLYLSLLSRPRGRRPGGRAAQGVERVQHGDLDRGPVYDGSEIGQLQAGFNAWSPGCASASGSRTCSVATSARRSRAALEREVELGGEPREVARSCSPTCRLDRARRDAPPQEVVELLNGFFGIVVEVVDEHGGWVNKFEGDAALAVFGAPVPLDDPASQRWRPPASWPSA